MADNFNASLVINTAASEAGIRRLDSATKDLDKTLLNLHSSLKAGQSDLDAVAASMKALTSRNAELIRSEQDRAKATILAAKADGIALTNADKRQTTANKTRMTDAKVARIQQQTMASGLSSSATSTRRDAESRARIAGTQAVAQQNLATATVRTATAQQGLATATIRTAGATDAAAARADRLAASQRRAADSALSLNDNLSNSRYLLYDVGATYTAISAALLAIPVATAAVAIAYEKDFAQVIRTNDTLKGVEGGFSSLRQELKSLATEIPLSFGEFANIATIGGQLGIAGDAIESFTETTARFGAASNVSLDQAATSFGRLQNSFDPLRQTPDFFNKIGSSIAYVGVKSAATETEIIAVTNQISAAGAQFGFTADQIVGLSGALASVRIRPELARGAFQRIMLGLSRAADEGADSFENFAKYTGLAGQAGIDLFKSDPSAFFYKYVGGIKSAIAETGSVSAVLDDIGAKNVFDKQFILGLANGYNVFGDSLKNASTSFNEGTFLNESTQGVFETMDAKLTRISNSIKNFADTIAKGSVGAGSGLAKTADALLAVVSAADRFARASSGFTTFINIVLGLGSAIGILLAFKAAQAFLLAGLVGFQQVLGKGTLAAGLTAKGILQQVAVTMLMAKGASEAHAQSLVKHAGAFKAMGIAAATSAAMVKAGTLAGIGGVSDAAPVATSRLGGLARGFGTLTKGALGFVGGPAGALILALGSIGLAFLQAEEKANSAGDAIARAGKNGSDAAKRAIAEQLTSRTVDSFTTDISAGGIGNHGKNVRKIASEVGISFDRIVESIGKGEKATKDFGKVLDEYSQKKGFANFADLQAKSFTNLDNKKGELQFLRDVVNELGTKSAESAKDVKAVDGAAGALGETAANAAPSAEGLAEEIGGVGDEADTAAEKVDKFLGAIFGIADANAATESALQAIGEGLAKSTDFGTGTEGGRDNISNFQDAIKYAILEQQNLIDTTGKTTAQASADYIAFVEGLVSEMTARGVDPAQIASVANKAKSYFSAQLKTGEQPSITVKVNEADVFAKATSVKDTVQAYLNRDKPAINLQANTLGAYAEINTLAQAIVDLTGYPYKVVLDALTDPAAEKSQEIYDVIRQITEGTYVVPINAKTDAAKTNVKNFVDYASKALASVQNAYNQVAASAPTFAKYTKGAFKGVTGVTNTAPEGIRRPTPAAVTAIAAPVAKADVVDKGTAPDFKGLGRGYDDVRKAAEKAGKSGKKAGEDMADGISDATRAANDYANRLKTGFQSAFDMQYGVQKATDEYHTALNAINKKREDELKQIDDLIVAQKELNDARKEELINARKAGIEKNISMKYGEVDRAADYANQEQTALDAAAAKQKDIVANQATITSVRAGIGELNGYSDAAIANREALRNLETKMTDMVVAYAATGASVDQVRAYAANLTTQFKTDVAQMGYNQVAVGALQGSLERYIDVINAVPPVKPTEVTADTEQASDAISGIANQLSDLPDNHNIDVTVGWKMTSFAREIPDYKYQGQQVWGVYNSDGSSTGQKFFNKGGHVGYAGGGHVGGKPPANPRVDNIMTTIDGKRSAGLRSGEFVMREPAVKFWGLDAMNNMNKMKSPMFNGGGSVGQASGGGAGGTMVVALDAETLAFLASLKQDIKLYADSKELASVVNNGNKQLVAEGMNR